MGYSNQIGPLLVQYLYVYGFERSVSLGGNVDSMTFEHIQLDEPQFCGLCNYGQVVMARGVTIHTGLKDVYGIYQHIGSNSGLCRVHSMHPQ